MQQMQAVCGLESPYPFLLLIHGTHMLQTVLASLILIHLSHLLEVQFFIVAFLGLLWEFRLNHLFLLL